MSKRNLWYLILYLSCPQDKLSRPMTRTKSGPTLEHPHWSFHPFGTIQQIILHRFKIWPDIKRTRKPNDKYWHDQVQAETGTQASAKFFRVLQFSGNFLLSFFCCSEGQLPIYLCTTRFTFLHPKQLSPGGTPGKWEWNFPQVEEVTPPWQSERVSKLANNAHWRPLTTNCNLCRQRWRQERPCVLSWREAGIPWWCTWTPWPETWRTWARSSTSTLTPASFEGKGARDAHQETGACLLLHWRKKLPLAIKTLKGHI